MAKSDWTIINGSYTWINSDSVSTSHCLDSVGSAIPEIQYNSLQKDVRLSSYFKSKGGADYILYLKTRWVDANNYYYASITYAGSAGCSVRIYRVKSGVITNLGSYTYIVAMLNWNRFAFEVTNDGLGNIILRISVWDGALWNVLLSGSDTIAAGIDSSGYYNVGWKTSRIDDVLVEVKA